MRNSRMSAEYPVYLFEEHSSVLPVWWQQAGAPLTVVYLDAHLDLQQTDDDTIRRLRECRSVEDVRALEAPHHLDDSHQYAFGIENFLYPAHRIALIERLVWVAPPHVPRQYSHQLLEYVQQMDGISFDELTGFDAVGESALRGRLLGLDITICGVDELASLDIPADYCLDVDIDYFVTVPGDTLWTDPGDTTRTLVEALGAPRLATVSRAVGSGFTPLHHRFVGDYVAAVLRGDAEAAHRYHKLYEAVAALDSGNGEHAATICRAILEEQPACAATCFVLACALDDAGSSRAMRDQAIELDPAYGPDPCRDVCAFPNRRKPLNSEQLRALAGQLDAADLDHEQRALAAVAMARLYAETGAPGRAWEALNAQPAAVDNSDVLLAIAGAVLAGPEPFKAAPLLARARQYDKTRTSAAMHLGDLAVRAGRADRARVLYEEAAARAPAWILPLERLRRCHEILGSADKAAELAALIEDRTRVLARLAGTP